MALKEKLRGFIKRHVIDDEPETRCLHDEDDRMSVARMGHPNAFICRKCGHREDA